MPDDKKFMARALQLARRGAGRTHPNPMVGAVVVKKGRVLGEGWHHGTGEPHAEVVALGNAGLAAKGGTLYVNLEPCDHHGRTPPCTEAVIKAQIASVVVAGEDPHPLVSGKGLKHLIKAGVKVKAGIMREQAEELNRAYLHYARQNVPYVTLKMASTLDGRIADISGHSKWITGNAARLAVHRLRAEADAVLVGVGTVLADNPRLSVRGVRSRKQPLRVILDPALRIPLDSQLVEEAEDGRTLVVVERSVSVPERRPFEEKGVRFLALQGVSGLFQWPDLAAALVELGVLHLQVEGGAKTATWFLTQSAVKRVELFMAMKLLGNKGIPSVMDLGITGLEDATVFEFRRCRSIGCDVHIVADVK